MNRKIVKGIEEKVGLQERLDLVQKIGHIGILEWNITSNQIHLNPQDEILLGFVPGTSKLSIKNLSRTIHPEDYPLFDNLINESLSKKKDFEVEFRVLYPDQSIHWIFGKYHLAKDSKGKLIRMIGVNIDITERKHIEINTKFLYEASKILSSSLDWNITLNRIASLAVPLISDWCAVDILDKDGDIQQVAIAHKDPKKIEWAKQLRKSTPIDMSAPTGLPNVLRTGKPEIYPYVSDEILVASAKNPKSLKLMRSLSISSVIIVPLFSQEKPIGTITFVTAESRKRYDQSDLLMAEKLASRASLAIENSMLYKESQQAIRLRDEFISIASHELKTPITSMKVYTQLLQKIFEEKNDPDALLYLNKINQQITKQTKLISDLLDVSKIQVGKLAFEVESFNIEDLMREIVESIQATIETHKIVIKGGFNKKIKGDKDRIGQVIINLLTNAIKYSPDANQILVEILPEGDKINISIKDFGIGIAKENLTRIFERFYQIQSKDEKTFPGLGIGLYISSEIIKRHGGELRVKSIKGKGSTFSFTLPLKNS